MSGDAWVGVDLDGTLAFYDGWRGIDHIGKIVPAMKYRIKRWVSDGVKVKIFTARASEPKAIPYIEKWLEANGLGGLEITNVKDFAMVELWDDRCIQVVPNTGRSIQDVLENGE